MQMVSPISPRDTKHRHEFHDHASEDTEGLLSDFSTHPNCIFCRQAVVKFKITSECLNSFLGFGLVFYTGVGIKEQLAFVDVGLKQVYQFDSRIIDQCQIQYDYPFFVGG